MGGLLADRAFQAGLRGGLGALVVVGAALLLRQAWEVIEPLIVAVVLATILWPWVSRIAALPLGPARWCAPRLFATALIYAVTFLSVGLILWLALLTLLPEIERGLEAYPEQTASVRQYIDAFRAGDLAGGVRRMAEDAARGAPERGGEPARPGNGRPAPVDVTALAVGLLGGFARLALVLVFTFFLLLEGDRLAGGLLLLVPDGSRAAARALGLRIRDRVSRWVLAQAIYGAVSGLIIGATLGALQLPSAWLYGVVGATLGVFPALGPWVATVPAFVVALGLAPWKAAVVAAFGLAMYIADSTAISTKIYGEVLRLPLFVVLLALFLGGALMGVWGALIATPVAAALDLVIREHLGRGAAPEGAAPDGRTPGAASPDSEQPTHNGVGRL
jgi:predicted PurR-regulated permease PerM